MGEYIATYDPLSGDVLASAGIVLIPIISLFVLLFFTKVIYAAILALAGCILVACFLFKMPAGMAFLATLHGMLFGFWPVCLIISAAIFLFDVCVVTGHFDVLKYTLVSLTRDRRCLALILGYTFSGVIEGGSGFSTPIALCGAMMVGVGFEPLDACVACLLGNTIAVVSGGVGIPTLTLSTVTGIESKLLAGAIQRLMLPFSLLMPWLVVYSVCSQDGILSGVRRTAAVWPACLLVSLVQTGTALLLATFVGPATVSIASFLVALISLATLLKYGWQPTEVLLTPGMAREEVGHNTKGHLGTGIAGAAAPVAVIHASPSNAVPASALTRHLSLLLERRHPIRGVQEIEGPGTGASVASLDQGGVSTADTGMVADAKTATLFAADEPAPLAPAVSIHPSSHPGTRTGTSTLFSPRAFIMRRLELTDSSKARLDSSAVATALFPHTMEYGHDWTLTLSHVRRSSIDAVNAAASVYNRGITGIRSMFKQSEQDKKAEPAQQAGEPAPSALDVQVSEHANPAQTGNGGHGDGHAKEAAGLSADVTVHYDALHPPSRTAVALAWFPWLLLAVSVTVWGSPAVKNALNVATILVSIPGLDKRVVKPDTQAGGAPHIVAAVWTLDLLGAAGVCIYLVVGITLAVYRVHPAKAARLFARSVSRMSLSFLTILVLMAFGYVLKASGQDVTLGLAAAKTGAGYPFVGAFIGFLGVALTGSATSTSVIFGSLQVVAATKIGLSPTLMAAANMVGGILGHTVSTSSMVVAGVSTGLPAKGIGPILRAVGGYALILIIAFGAWNMLVAHAITGYIPTALH